MKWIRIWPHAWFDSSMRVELTNAERAFWVDVIALAGKSRIPGVICSDPEGKVGYPLPMLSSLLVSWTPQEVTSVLEKLEKTQRVQVEHTALLSGEDGWIVRVTNWEKWQSESQRVQKYRNTSRSEKRNQRSLITNNSCTSGRIEVEVEVEEEVEEEKKKTKAQAAPSPLAFDDKLLRVSKSQDNTLAEAFPWVDRQREYRFIVSWLSANPKRRPRSASRFLHNWFAKVRTPQGKVNHAAERTEQNLRTAGLL
jgi:hypothetical protein